MITFKDLPRPIPNGLQLRDISHQEWREYEHGGVTYRINKPIGLYFRPDGTTHRIVDSEGVTPPCSG